MKENLASRIIANTRRHKRVLDLVEIAEDIKKLVDILGSTKAASQLVLLSESMINQFLSVLKLHPEVLKLVKSRAIDSVSSAFYLSKFSFDDQKELAQMIIDRRVNSAELRLIIPIRERFGSINASDLVQKLKESKNKKVSVIKFEVEESTSDFSIIELKLLSIMEKKDLISIEKHEKKGLIRLTPDGEKQLREAARKSKKNLQDYMYTILY